MSDKNKFFLNRDIFTKWYLQKGLILIDIFIIIGLIQYFIFNGSFKTMVEYIIEKIW